ncbi:MAG: DUF6506 family protein [Oscillospiraceae bacterium]|nr:DUF6506 family protein [Oscillospiraceae bacterium]
MKFAFIIMGDFNADTDTAVIHNASARIIGVADLKEACEAAMKLREDGIDCIELCGAFGVEGAKEVIRATGNQICVGYITHLPEQDELYRATFQHN